MRSYIFSTYITSCDQLLIMSHLLQAKVSVNSRHMCMCTQTPPPPHIHILSQSLALGEEHRLRLLRRISKPKKDQQAGEN